MSNISEINGQLINAESSSFAATASLAPNYVLNSATSSFTTNTGSLLTTASVNLNTITFTKGDGSTFPITVNTGSGGSGGTNLGLVYVVSLGYILP